MAWIDDVLKSEYSVVKVLKKNENKSLLVYRNNKIGRQIVCRKFKGHPGVYNILKRYTSEELSEIYEVFETNGEITVLEEFIDGITVGDVLCGGLYNEDGVRAIIKDVCDGLSALHSLGIIHRDIKPENVMITNNGEVKIIDFDAARIFKNAKSADTQIIGTTGYAAPEQFGLAQSDERTDIFAVGILMNVMLTGEHPSKRMYKGKLSKIIEKATRIDPEKRYRTAEELKKYL